MNKNIKILTLPALLCCASVAQADGAYVGAKLGLVSVDASEFDNATNAGIVLGYDFVRSNATFSVEGELTTTLSDGDLSMPGAGKAEWDITTMAIYGVTKLQLSNSAYLKGKLGVLNEDVSVNTAFGSFSEDDTGMSFGFGLGFKIREMVSLEVEYTIIEDDVDFFSVGSNLSF